MLLDCSIWTFLGKSHFENRMGIIKLLWRFQATETYIVIYLEICADGFMLSLNPQNVTKPSTRISHFVLFHSKYYASKSYVNA